MSKTIQTFFCEICKKMISSSEENAHRLNCRQSLNNKLVSSKKTYKSISKTKKHSNTVQLNFQPLSIDINNNQISCFSLDLVRENSINFSSEEKLNDDGIMNVINLNANYSLNNNLENESNIININSVSIFESFIVNINPNPIDKKILDNLNVNIINDMNEIPDSKCIICLQDYALGDRYIILPCIHIYHEECIKHWLNINNKCPTCNHVLSLNDIR